MNKLKFLLLLATLTFGGCGGCMTWQTIQPGHVGIVVSYYGSQKGVQDIVLKTGRIWYSPWNEQVLEYPTFVQPVVWTHNVVEGNPVNEEITFTNKDSMQFAVDVSMAYHIEESKIPAFYVKFRTDKLKEFSDGFLHNVAREKFDETGGKYSIDQIMGDNATFLGEVRSKLQNEVKSYGIIIDQFGLIGSPRPPKAVIDSINAKAKQVQDAVTAANKVAQTEAEARQQVARAEGEAKSNIARAEGEAKANALLTQSLTDKLIQWRQLQIQEEAIKQWDGKRPMVEGNGSGLILQLPK